MEKPVRKFRYTSSPRSIRTPKVLIEEDTEYKKLPLGLILERRKLNEIRKNVVFTICDFNYLSQAQSLGDSILRYNKDVTYIIFTITHLPVGFINKAVGFQVWSIWDLGIKEFPSMEKKYELIEFATAVKPFLFEYLYEKYEKIEKVIYLDPDILVYCDVEKIFVELNNNSIILTPHMLSPMKDNLLPSEQNILNAGVFNLGFIGVKKSEEVIEFLRWWKKRLFDKCFIKLQEGLFLDQIWINLVPIYFKNVKILKDLGYNVGHWNTHERIISKVEGIYYVNSSYPLVFYHFSGFEIEKENIYISKFSTRHVLQKRNDLVELYEEYKKQNRKNNNNFFRNNKTKDYFNGVNVYGYLDGTFGIAEMSRKTTNVLKRSKINYGSTLLQKQSSTNFKKDDKNFYINLLSINPDDFSLSRVDLKNLKNKYNIGIWFWELNHIPKFWITNSQHYDEIWVFSDFIKDVLNREISNIPVKKITFYTEKAIILNKRECKKKLGFEQDDFICLFIFDAHSDLYRKNPIGVIKSFQLAFQNKEKIKLIIKSKNLTLDEINILNNSIEEDKRIILINEDISYEDINVLFNSSDVYISLHRSEGFGITLLNALMLEKPLICTSYSGNLEFCREEFCELIGYKIVPVDGRSVYIRLLRDRSLNVKDINWAEPNIEEAALKLKGIYYNYDHYVEKAKKAKGWIENNYNIDVLSSQIVTILNY